MSFSKVQLSPSVVYHLTCYGYLFAAACYAVLGELASKANLDFISATCFGIVILCLFSLYRLGKYDDMTIALKYVAAKNRVQKK